ncbi:ribosome recycling factor [Mesoterricola sediminis]|uniref:Ribosome-recycling factor n=1 Tax=Mesoterricola sediminis TaxID=2927980 RepID=A0AA48GSL2_9BACT|nr:ribosome recycling factor [Mesoterricola sediminis]BDU75419.1 ribosome-recycling factor [Mesoterricola sediminis]
MTANVETILADAKKKMKSSLDTLKKEMATVRTGRANAGILDTIQVEYYGANMPLNQIAGVSVPEPAMLVITPFDKSAIKAIEHAILKSELGLNPANDGVVIRLPIPPLTEERRRDLTKVVNRMGEEIKTAIRNVRRDANEDVKKLEKDKTAPLSEDAAKKALDQIQKATDESIREVDDIVKHKDAEIMHV